MQRDNLEILIVKTSSLGDIVHAITALEDALNYKPNINYTWICEENFAELPKLSRSVSNILPIAIRRWKKEILQPKNFFKTIKEIYSSLKKIRKKKYDLVIDAQGLLKSAIICRLTKTYERHGFCPNSARESVAAIFYDYRHPISNQKHAIVRIIELLRLSIGYANLNHPYKLAKIKGDNLKINKSNLKIPSKQYILFLHGTTWENKKWPLQYWKILAALLEEINLNVCIFYHGNKEMEFASEIAKNVGNCFIIEDRNILNLAAYIKCASVAISGDTGLAHLCSYLGVKTIGMYGPTSLNLSGMYGYTSKNIQSQIKCSPCMLRYCPIQTQKQLAAPCMLHIKPEIVFKKILKLLDKVQ